MYLRDRRRADERHRLHVRMREQRVDRLLVAVHDVEHAVGQARFLEELREPHRGRRHFLGGLQDEGVAARDRDRIHPQRHHRREIERRDAGAHAERLAQRVRIDVGADVFAVLAFHEVRNAHGEFDHLETALDRARGVGERLAVLFGDEARELFAMRVDQLAIAHEDARAPQRRRVAPRGKRRFRRGHRRVDVRFVAETAPGARPRRSPGS